MATLIPTPVPKLLRLPAVCEATGLTRSTLYRLVAASRFPRPAKIASNLSVWPSNEVECWIADRIAERDGTSPGGAA